MRRRRAALAALAICGLILAALASLVFGSADVSVADVVGALWGFDGSTEQQIVRDIRVPRTIVGLVVGIGLGMSGSLLQALTRNPLAEPGLLGINAGAALAVVIGISALGIGTPAGQVPLALGGAAVASVAVLSLGSVAGRGRAPVKLVIAGAVLAAMLASLTSAFLVLDDATLLAFRFWIVGSLAGATLEAVGAVFVPILIGVLVAVASTRALNAMALGDDVARSLGIPVGGVRLVGYAAAVLLAGGAVAAAGPIVFVGLAVPHVARALVGPDWRWIVPLSAIIGPTLLLAADVVARIIARPAELQVGIVTALVGAPLFIALVRRRRLAAL